MEMIQAEFNMEKPCDFDYVTQTPKFISLIDSTQQVILKVKGRVRYTVDLYKMFILKKEEAGRQKYEVKIMRTLPS